MFNAVRAKDLAAFVSERIVGQN